MNSALNDLVESRIQEAQRQGQFDDLPGQGRPLAIDDDPLVPEEVRVAHRILKNAGFVPPEVETLRERAGLARLLAQTPADADDATVRRARRKMMAMTMALEARGVRVASQAFADYRQRLIERLGRDS